jgi:hypothetical protein
MDFSVTGPDFTTTNRPFRFWVNDDNDAGETGGNDIPGLANKLADALEESSTVDSVRDLVDFFPVYLNIQSLLQAAPSNSVSCWLKQADGALNFVDPLWYMDTALSPTNCLAYLTDTNVVRQIARVTLSSAPTYQITSNGVPLNSAFVYKIRQEGKGMLLLEARRNTAKPLVLELRQGTNVIAQTRLHLSISGVEQMFRHKNLIWETHGQHIGPPDRLTDGSVPNEPPTNDKNFVFLHGYNVNPEKARGLFAEIFKRLYWSGSRAKFYGVTWRGAESQLFGRLTPNYHTNVVNAFLTAPKLRDFLVTLTNGPTTVAAHSLGNMVVLTALNDWDAPMDKYFMIDAAVAIAAIDGGASETTPMVHPDWYEYATRLWASKWHLLFSTNDYRSQLTWRDRLSNFGNAEVFNFYSSGEEVLRTHPGMPPDVPGYLVEEIVGFFDTDPPGLYVWALQEKMKGRTLFNSVLGSNHGGWGFNTGYDVFTNGQYIHLPPAQASQLPDAQLRTSAFFNTSFDTPLFGVSGSAYAQTNRNRILADAIPALTLPVGANEVPRLSPQGQPSRNLNMHEDFKNGWPLERDEPFDWLHSDFRDVAYTFVYKVFDEFVNRGNLKSP